MTINRLPNCLLLRKHNALHHRKDLYPGPYRSFLSYHLGSHKCLELRRFLYKKFSFSFCTIHNANSTLIISAIIVPLPCKPTGAILESIGGAS